VAVGTLVHGDANNIALGFVGVGGGLKVTDNGRKDEKEEKGLSEILIFDRILGRWEFNIFICRRNNHRLMNEGILNGMLDSRESELS